MCKGYSIKWKTKAVEDMTKDPGGDLWYKGRKGRH